MKTDIISTENISKEIGGDIELKNVRFVYPDSGIVALKDFSMKISAGESVAILGTTGLSAENLKLEITESVVMDDVESAIAVLKHMKSLKVKLGIDDFGRERFNFSNNLLTKVPDCLLSNFNRIKTDSAYQAGTQFFQDSNYVESYKAVLFCTQYDTTKYGDLSFYSLFVGEYQIAIEAAQKALAYNPEKVSVEKNLALGHLLNNQYDKAEVIYKKWKGKKFSEGDDDIADKAFLQDIKDLEAARIHHKDFERVKKLFAE